MFSASKGQDFLDTLFSGHRDDVPNGSAAKKLPLLRPSVPVRNPGPSVPKGSEGNNYPDKIRNRVKSLKKHRKRDAILKSITADSLINNSAVDDSRLYGENRLYNEENRRYGEESIISKNTSRGNTSRGNTDRSSPATEQNIIPPSHAGNANMLRMYAAEFARCLGLRESFVQQLDRFYSSVLTPFSQFQTQFQIQGTSKSKGTSVQRHQFLLLIIAIRKNSVRVVECYQIVFLLFSTDQSDLAVMTLRSMRRQIRDISDLTPFTPFPEPFSSWLTVTSHRNFFFIQRKIDGTSANLSGVHSNLSGVHSNLSGANQNLSGVHSNLSGVYSQERNNNPPIPYPSELHLNAAETEKIEILGSYVWGIVEAVRGEELMERKNRKNKEIFDSFLYEENVSDDERNEHENEENEIDESPVESDFESPYKNQLSRTRIDTPNTPNFHDDEEQNNFIQVQNKNEKIIMKLFWMTWKDTSFMRLKIEGMKNCRDRNIQEKVFHFLHFNVWRSSRYRGLQLRGNHRATRAMFDGWVRYYEWCKRFNSIYSKSNTDWLRFFFSKLKNFSKHVFRNRDFKRTVALQYLRTSFKCIQYGILLDRYRICSSIRFKSSLTFSEKYCTPRYHFEKWRENNRVSRAFTHLNLVREMVKVKNYFEVWVAHKGNNKGQNKQDGSKADGNNKGESKGDNKRERMVRVLSSRPLILSSPSFALEDGMVVSSLINTERTPEKDTKENKDNKGNRDSRDNKGDNTDTTGKGKQSRLSGLTSKLSSTYSKIKSTGKYLENSFISPMKEGIGGKLGFALGGKKQEKEENNEKGKEEKDEENLELEVQGPEGLAVSNLLDSYVTNEMMEKQHLEKIQRKRDKEVSDRERERGEKRVQAEENNLRRRRRILMALQCQNAKG